MEKNNCKRIKISFGIKELLYKELNFKGGYIVEEYELPFSNICINNTILTCIDENNNAHAYKMINKKAHKNDLVYIYNANDYAPFNKCYIGKILKVTGNENTDILGWVKNHVVVGNWFLYDYQYIVLKELK
jgi:hypothetical protein